MGRNRKERWQIYHWQVSHQQNKIISNKNYYARIKHSLIDKIVILQKEAILDVWSIQVVTQKNKQQNLEVFMLRKNGREKMQMVKVVKSSRQVTWTQKRRVSSLISNYLTDNR